MVGRLFRPTIVVTILCLMYCLAVIAIRGKGDPLILMTIGTNFNPNLADHAYSEEGYDGQFTYYIAVNPGNDYLDVPAYRFQRILLPISGFILSFSQKSLIPFTLLAINLLALAGGTFILEQLLISHKVSRWYAIGYGMSIGVFGSARLMTTETLAYGLVLLAIWLYQRDKWLWSALIFGLSALSKEMTLIFVAGYFLYFITQKQWMRAILFSLFAGIPFAALQLFLYSQLGSFGIGSGGRMATSFEIIPFMGFFKILTEGNIGIFAVLAPIIGAFVILPTLWGLWQCWKDFQSIRYSQDTDKKKNSEIDLYTFLLFVNSAIMLFVPFSTYREPLGILRFIVGLQIAVILYAAKRRKVRALMNSTIWFVTTLFLLMSDFGGMPS